MKIYGILILFFIDCLSSDIRNTYYRVDNRYNDRLPQTGILWTKSNILVRWCLYGCLRDIDCVSIFFHDGGTCHGFPEKLHDLIPIARTIGMRYYELAGPVGNVAAGKPAIQSSYLFDDPSFGAENAVDSFRFPLQNAKVHLRSCAHTSPDDYLPFWQVDLGSRHLVLSVSFLSRNECCGGRNQRLNITVSDTATGPRALCVYYPGPAFVGQMKTFFCEKPEAGQFLRVSRDDKVLNPCEIEVYAYPLK